MTIGEWIKDYRRECPAATLSECVKALRTSGEWEQCKLESAAQAPPRRRYRPRKPKQLTADDRIQNGLEALNQAFARMIKGG